MKNTFIGAHLDFIGFSASLACAIHCAFLPFVISTLPFLGLGFLANPYIEYAVVLSSLFLALYALSHGYIRHHQKMLPILIVSLGFLIISIGLLWAPESLESVITPLGAIVIAWGHFLNWKAIKKSKVDYPSCTQARSKHEN
ncbi:MerC domain-containing protein [Algoriphagus sp. PAP.12]|uniref:MerC domain-containing protein n=1 Tax=Algoriphagus sp. PAP.12 TaxID=2996678 RepID=UPI00227AE0F9|nr:MerC domain-containing protein [Algoriphagus sp. PAP.12]